MQIYTKQRVTRPLCMFISIQPICSTKVTIDEAVDVRFALCQRGCVCLLTPELNLNHVK